MTISEYAEQLRLGIYGALTSLGSATLPSILAVPFLVFIYLKATHPTPGAEQATEAWAGLRLNYISQEWLAIFSSSSFMGAVGSTVSFFARREDLKKDMRRPQTVAGTQLLGALFASVLVLVFVGGLVEGSLFPSIKAGSWTDLFFRLPDWSKLLVWSFIAGFSERFVPDLLDNLILRGGKKDEPPAHPDRSVAL